MCAVGSLKIWDPKIHWAVQAYYHSGLRRRRQRPGTSKGKQDIYRQMRMKKYLVNKILPDHSETMGNGNLTNRLS